MKHTASMPLSRLKEERRFPGTRTQFPYHSGHLWSAGCDESGMDTAGLPGQAAGTFAGLIAIPGMHADRGALRVLALIAAGR